MKNLIKTIKVGNTPLVELKKIKAKYSLKGNIFAKVESFNPAGSVKDRPAYEMFLDAINKGGITKDTTLIEPTSGNTGIAIAYIARELGLRCILTMPETMTVQRRQILASYGAQLELTPGSEGMKGSIRRANELLKEIPNSIILGQFDNPANPLAHYKTTGPEIYSQLNGKVDVFIAGVGTGGTLSGAGKYLKEKTNVKVLAVEPATSAVLSGKQPGKHGIQGIGPGFIPNTLDTKIYDGIRLVETDEAIEKAREVRDLEGLSVGISAGAALAAAIKEASLDENLDKNIVIIFPDGGDRYSL